MNRVSLQLAYNCKLNLILPAPSPCWHSFQPPSWGFAEPRKGHFLLGLIQLKRIIRCAWNLQITFISNFTNPFFQFVIADYLQMTSNMFWYSSTTLLYPKDQVHHIFLFPIVIKSRKGSFFMKSRVKDFCIIVNLLTTGLGRFFIIQLGSLLGWH